MIPLGHMARWQLVHELGWRGDRRRYPLAALRVMVAAQRKAKDLCGENGSPWLLVLFSA